MLDADHRGAGGLGRALEVLRDRVDGGGRELAGVLDLDAQAAGAGELGDAGLGVLARLLWDPAINGADVGEHVILNWLLAGYGVPAASTALAAGRC